MKSFRSLQKRYPDLEPFRTPHGLKIRNKYISPIIQGVVDWTLSLAAPVPKHLERFASQNGRSFTRDMIGDSRKEAIGLAQIIPCKVISIIDAAPTINYEKNKIILEDIVVCQPVKKAQSELRIYVRQSKAGAFQPERISDLVGQLVPVKIINLIQIQKAKRANETSVSDELYDKYVALGDIEIAEYLKNIQVVREVEDAKLNGRKDAPIFDTQIGIVNHITPNGVFIHTKNNERVFIQYKHLTYKRKSPIWEPTELVKLGEHIDFRFTSGEIRPLPKEKRELGISGSVAIVTGERLSLEENPENVIKRVIDSGPGTVVSGYIVTYHEIKGHLFEVDGAYGYPIRLVTTEHITKNMFTNKEKISVILTGSGSYRYTTNKNDVRYLEVRATCQYNSTYTTDDDLDDFFD